MVDRNPGRWVDSLPNGNRARPCDARSFRPDLVDWHLGRLLLPVAFGTFHLKFMQVDWWWLIIIFFIGIAFGSEERESNKKKKNKDFDQ